MAQPQISWALINTHHSRCFVSFDVEPVYAINNASRPHQQSGLSLPPGTNHVSRQLIAAMYYIRKAVLNAKHGDFLKSPGQWSSKDRLSQECCSFFMRGTWPALAFTNLHPGLSTLHLLLLSKGYGFPLWLDHKSLNLKDDYHKELLRSFFFFFLFSPTHSASSQAAVSSWKLGPAPGRACHWFSQSSDQIFH